MSLPQNSISRPRFLCNCEPAVLYVRMLSGTVLARQTFASRRFLVRAVAAKLSALIAGVAAPCVEGLRFFPSFRENASRLFCAPLYRTRPIVSMEHSYIYVDGTMSSEGLNKMATDAYVIQYLSDYKL